MTAASTPGSVEELRQLVGRSIGPTNWDDLTQAQVDAFADLTGDHQWIHVNTARSADGPFGGTIAHGLYTLSRGQALSRELFDYGKFQHVLNYGYNKIRFPSPTPVGARIRLSAEITGVMDVDGGVQVTTVYLVEAEGVQKPVMVAESVLRVLTS